MLFLSASLSPLLIFLPINPIPLKQMAAHFETGSA